jgi:hypothetical protein
MRDLFHGTIYEIKEIDLVMGKGYKDFGKGFYATAVKSHAESIAKRNKHLVEIREAQIHQRNPEYKMKTYQAYRYNLEFDDECIAHSGELKIKVFDKADREWVKFVLQNRNSDTTIHDFDIVIGPTADENTVTIINSYREELLRTNYADDVLDALIEELEPENLPKQYYFGTKRAIEKLRFKKIRREIVG